jgi:predicted SAM-dependent methyltransferase
MIAHARQMREAGIPFVFDPGQAMPLFDRAELAAFVRDARYIAVNDYECEMLQERSGMSVEALAGEVDAMIITRGAEGSDIIANGETLDCVADESQDFVIANHFLEHCEDPIGALKNFLRVVRRGGVIFVAIPDKRFTFDVRRDVTTFEHLLRDHLEGGERSRLGHFEDYHRVVLGITDERQIRRDMEEMGHTHYHVWTQVEMLELVVRLRKDLGLDFEVEAFQGNRALGEGIIVLRKGAAKNSAEEELSCINVVREDYRKRYPDFEYKGALHDG